MISSRTIVVLSPLAVFLLLESLLFWPSMFYVVVALADALIAVSIWRFCRRTAYVRRWPFIALLPLVFLSSLSAFVSLFSNPVFLQIFFIGAAVYLYFYLYSFYLLAYQGGKQRNFSIEQVLLFGIFLTVFFSAASVYGLGSLLNLPFWILLLCLLAVISAVFAVTADFYGFHLKNKLPLFMISGLALIELSWALLFLPLRHYIIGFVFAVQFYMLFGILRFYLLGSLDRRIIRLYLGFGLASSAAVLLTARWL